MAQYRPFESEKELKNYYKIKYGGSVPFIRAVKGTWPRRVALADIGFDTLLECFVFPDGSQCGVKLMTESD